MILKDYFSLQRLCIGFCFVTALVLAGCSTPQNVEGEPVPTLTFTNYEPYVLSVGSVSVVDAVGSEDYSNDRSSYFPISPMKALQNYLGQRFVAGDPDAGNMLTISIMDASLPYTLNKSENVILSTLSLDQKEEYTLNYVVKIDLQAFSGKSMVASVIRYRKSREFDRSLSLVELERGYMAFVEESIAELDASIIKSLRDNFNVIAQVGGTVQKGAVQSDGFFEQLNDQSVYPKPQAQAYDDNAPRSGSSGAPMPLYNQRSMDAYPPLIEQ